MNDALAKMAEFYRPQYGEQTDALFAALSQPTQKIALINPHLAPQQLRDMVANSQKQMIAGMPFYHMDKDGVVQEIGGLMSHYFLDLSSVLPPLLLPLANDMRILDMCAAPGGKLLVMLSRNLRNAHFVANDLSSARAFRLKKVVQGFFQKPFLDEHVRFSVKDASFFGLKNKANFDAILLDAPCSSEGHVVKNPSLLRQYRGLSRSLPMRQYSLLSSALLALKPGGHLMYATCSINKNENEGVIKKLMHKKGDTCSIVTLESPYGESTAYGISILPHLNTYGPAFFSLIRKNG